MKKKMMIVLAVIAAAILLGAVALGVFSAKQDVNNTIVEETAQQENALQETAETESAGDAAAQEEETFEIAELYGTVIEAADGYVLLESTELGKVQANISDDTMIEGVEPIGIGQVAKVIYDGKMTRSIPAQVNAMLIGVYAVSGEVTEIADGAVTLRRADNGEDVIITLPQDAQTPAVGEAITAYTTGISTMSLPPQMNAVAIVK